MAPRRRHVFDFTDSWLVPAPPSVVREVLLDVGGYPRWWPQVRAVARIDDDGALVVCRSWLPYSLDLAMRAVRRDPDRLEIALLGDLVGWARFDLHPDRRGTRLEFAQRVEIGNPVLRLLARPARPLLEWNHEQMMRSGARGLAGYLKTGWALSVPRRSVGSPRVIDDTTDPPEGR